MRFVAARSLKVGRGKKVEQAQRCWMQIGRNGRTVLDLKYPVPTGCRFSFSCGIDLLKTKDLGYF
jgi:hypothetical protein